jgi:hypothetical protein
MREQMMTMHDIVPSPALDTHLTDINPNTCFAQVAEDRKTTQTIRYGETVDRHTVRSRGCLSVPSPASYGFLKSVQGN